MERRRTRSCAGQDGKHRRRGAAHGVPTRLREHSRAPPSLAPLLHRRDDVRDGTDRLYAAGDLTR